MDIKRLWRVFMGRFVSVFFITIMATVVLFFILAGLVGSIFVEIEVAIGAILIVLASLIITQLFFIMDLLQRKIR